MRTQTYLIPVVIFLLAGRALPVEEDPLVSAVSSLETATSPEAVTAAIDSILALEPDVGEVVTLLEEGGSRPAAAPGWQVRSYSYPDGNRRDYHLYVPETYDPGVPAPLLFHLHGGVSRPQLLTEEEMKGYRDWWKAEADSYGFLVAFPLGEAGAEWWKEVQADALEGMLREIRREFAVDGERVFATGFSDGGSGSFYLSMTHPTFFAGFIPLNGHPAVASGASGRNLFLANERARPLYVVNTQDDPLYPARSVLPYVDAMMKLGVSVRFTTYPGIGHRPEYRAEQNPLIADWMIEHPREPNPARIGWETADLDTGRFAWVTILGIGETPGAPELPDVNVMSTKGRVLIGIRVDQEFSGEGVRVDSVTEESVASEIGLAEGDVIVRIDDAPIPDLGALRAALGGKSWGDPVKVGWLRGDEEHGAEGRFPPFTPEPVFQRDRPSGRIEVERDGNRVEVRQRGVTRYALDLPAGIFDLSKEIVVTTNGEESFRGRVEPDLRHLLTSYARDRDPAQLYLARVTID